MSGSAVAAEAAGARRRWWPRRWPRLLAPAAAAMELRRVAGVASALVRGRRWAATGLLAGTLPLLLAWLLDAPGQRWATAAALLPPFLALVWARRARAAYGLVLVAFAAHSLLAISLTMADPAGAARLCAGGADYWQRNEGWIRTGVDPERSMAAWLPAQLRELAGMAFFGFTSLGLVSLAQGVSQLDLMNYFVGRLIPVSRSGAVALLFGWHAWAILRGIGYTRIVYETTSLGLARATGVALASRRERARRWGFGLAFIAADVALKAVALGTVREVLARNLTSP